MQKKCKKREKHENSYFFVKIRNFIWKYYFLFISLQRNFL